MRSLINLHGVHHLFHPPLAAPRLDWPAGRSVLVLIVRGLDAAALEREFAAAVVTGTEAAV